MSNSNPPSTPPVDSITLDTPDPYLNPDPAQILQMVIGYYDPHTDVFDKYGMDLQKGAKAIEQWHTKATTKDMLALIGEDETVNDTNIVTEYGTSRQARNRLRDELRQAIQAREDNQ